MAHPVSVRLDETTQEPLQQQARSRGIGLSTLPRELAETEARRFRRDRIRAQSRAVGQYVAASPEARAFYRACYEDWGTPTANGG